MIIEPRLSNKELDCLLLIRTLERPSVIEITIQDSLPITASIKYPDFLRRKPVSDSPLSDDERKLLELIKFVKFGKLVVRLSGDNLIVQGDSRQNVRLGNINFNDWA